MIAAAEAHADRAGFKPLAVVVLDSGGHVIAAVRQDGASNMRVEIARGKAHGALALGSGSRSLMERAEAQPYFVTAAGAAIGGALVPVPGGVLVQSDDGALIGAVGVSGGRVGQRRSGCSRGDHRRWIRRRAVNGLLHQS
jgi:uncharacterized protein GlcG (DUF336 family)